MRVYRWLLLAFPREFRRRFGEDMADLFVDRLAAARRHGWSAVVRLWLTTMSDVIRHGSSERRQSHSLSGEQPMRRSLILDLRFALRYLRRRPGFAATTLLTLGLGIGAATAVFTVANALLLRSMPYEEASRLVRLYERQESGFTGNLAMGNFQDWCAAPGLEACGAYIASDLNLAGGEAPDRVRGAMATTGLFQALRVRPIAGRLFRDDEISGAPPVVLVAEGAAKRLLGSSDVLGRRLLLDGMSHEVVGVLPEMPGLDNIAVWRPQPLTNQPRSNHAYRGVARVRADASRLAVQAQLDTISRRLQEAYPNTNRGWWAAVEPLQTSMSSDFAQTLRLLSWLVALLVILCAVNVASLVAGQAAGRRHELGIRLALGADRRRLVGQLCVESATLAAGGAIVGVLLAQWAVGIVMSALPSSLVPWRAPRIDADAFVFAVTIAAGSALLFGLWPALGLVRGASASRRMTAQPRSTLRQRGRALLTGMQAAIATVMLVVAALLGTVLLRLFLVDPGFKAEGVLTFRVTPPRGAYADAASLNAFFDELASRLGRRPDVESVGAAMSPPLVGPNTVRGVIRVGEPIPSREDLRLTLFQVTLPGYFRTLGIPLVEGRDFDGTDTEASRPVALINKELAGMLWPGESAVGREILVHTDEKAPRLVVGVVPDIKQMGLDDEPTPMYYVPLRQSPRRTMAYVVRTRGPVTRNALQTEIAALDGALPLYDLRPLDAVVAQSTSDRRAITSVAVFFGAAAVLLAGMGLYGLASTSVSERTREIGVRIALGARPASVLRLVVARGVLFTMAGVGLGLLASVPAVRLLEDWLTESPPSSALAMTVVAAVLMLVASVACLVPAQRALAIDPVEALRSE